MNRRDKAKAATRAKCLETARRLWAEPGTFNGPGGTTRDLAKAMNMSTGAIFANFTGIEDLWRQAFGTEPPIDSALTRAAPVMADMLRAAAPILRDAGHPGSADLIADLLAGLAAPQSVRAEAA